MDNNSSANKRSAEMNSSRVHSPRKAFKMNWNQESNQQNSSQATFSNTQKSSTSSIDSKLSNAAKLREQFVKEIEDIKVEMQVGKSVIKIFFKMTLKFSICRRQ